MRHLVLIQPLLFSCCTMASLDSRITRLDSPQFFSFRGFWMCETVRHTEKVGKVTRIPHRSLALQQPRCLRLRSAAFTPRQTTRLLKT